MRGLLIGNIAPERFLIAPYAVALVRSPGASGENQQRRRSERGRHAGTIADQQQTGAAGRERQADEREEHAVVVFEFRKAIDRGRNQRQQEPGESEGDRTPFRPPRGSPDGPHQRREEQHTGDAFGTRRSW